MEEFFVKQIFPSPIELALMLALFALAVWRGRPEWLMGAYLSTTLWTRTVMFGPVAHTWVLLAALGAAGVVYLTRDRKVALEPSLLRQRDFGLLPAHDRWIVPWMALWWGWMLLVLWQFDAYSKITYLRPLLLNIIAPLLVFWLFAGDARRLRGFAAAYVATTLVGCWQALKAIGLPISYPLSDPALSASGVIRLGLVNYHYFSHMLAIALILAVSLFLQAKRLGLSLLALGSAAMLAYFLLLVGARQSMVGVAIALALSLVWALRRSGLAAARASAVTFVTLAVGLLLYQIAPDLIVRGDEAGIEESFNVFAGRGDLWERGFQIFLTSPLWGRGFEESLWAHNLFIGTLADQGVIGMVFFLGFLFFVAHQSRGLWKTGPITDLAIWRLAFLMIVLFALIHGQASGNTAITAHLYWPAIVLWFLRARYDRAHPEEPGSLPVAAPARRMRPPEGLEGAR
jgi:hypothetical protein